MEESEHHFDILTLLQKCGDRSAFRLVAPTQSAYNFFKSPGLLYIFANKVIMKHSCVV
jgi:hypothetical protein